MSIQGYLLTQVIMASNFRTYVKAELDLFSQRPVQTDILESNYVYFYPLVNPSGNDGPIEFELPPNSNFLDLNDLSLGVEVEVKNGNANLAAAAEVAPVNNWLHSLFSDVTCFLDDTLIEGGSHLYPYKAYLSNLLLYGEAAKKYQLQTSGWAKDTAGQFEAAAANTGFATRKSWIAESKKCELEGPLQLDICQQGKLLLDKVKLRLKFIRSKAEFNLISRGEGEAQVKASVNITRAYIKVRQVTISSDRVNQIENALTHQNAIYPIQRTQMYTFTIPQGMQTFTQENLFHNRRPKMLLVGLVDNQDFNGRYAGNPFLFRHKRLNHIGLYIDGKPTPQIPLTPDFTNQHFVEEYRNLQRVVQLTDADGDIGISKNDFANGYTLYAYLLSPDGQVAGSAQPIQTGNIRLEMKFSQGLNRAVNVVCMAVYDDEIQISRMRNVMVNYLA